MPQAEPWTSPQPRTPSGAEARAVPPPAYRHPRPGDLPVLRPVRAARLPGLPPLGPGRPALRGLRPGGQPGRPPAGRACSAGGMLTGAIVTWVLVGLNVAVLPGRVGVPGDRSTTWPWWPSLDGRSHRHRRRARAVLPAHHLGVPARRPGSSGFGPRTSSSTCGR